MLDVEVPQADRPAGRLADDRKGLHVNVVEGFAVRQSPAELGRFRQQLLVAELLEERLVLIDVGNPLEVPLDLPGVGIA
jgi:hypothetical protein